MRLYSYRETNLSATKMIEAVLFDFDGTLTRPGAIDFAGMREALCCTDGQPILEYVETLACPNAQAKAYAILDEFEMRSAVESVPNMGAEDTIGRLKAMGLPLSVVTRNCREAVDRSLDNFPALKASDFAVILARDDALRPKPDPESVAHAAKAMGVPVARILCVGDYVFDVELARNAGCISAYLSPEGEAPAVKPDYLIRRLDEVLAIVSGDF